MRKFIQTANWFLSAQLGINLKLFLLFFLRFPRFILEYLSFRSIFEGSLKLLPCLHDRCDELGEYRSEYFWQDLLVAGWLNKACPVRHIDVGSRLDGFVAHVASFRELEVLDIRAIKIHLPGIRFHQVDITSEDNVLSFVKEFGLSDSVSCLHVLEHLGLGRYGDPIRIAAYQDGLSNLSKLLKTKGALYLSTPVGKECIQFNANQIFSLKKLLYTAISYDLRLVKLFLFSRENGLSEISQEFWEQETKRVDQDFYTLAILIFQKQ